MTEQQFGPYRLISLLGRGGMGEVWRAVDTRKGRQVALKVLSAAMAGDQDFARRFRREAALAAKLTAPNIVPIHDYGEIDGRLFIDMPLLDGSDLGALLAREGPLPAERAVGITVQVARALDIAHRAGLVHRDVKPSNIVVCDSGGGDHAYLIDFGIARALDGTKISLSGLVIGTPAYMAPERFAGEGDHLSDIYALGCVLYEALTGQQAFTASNLLAFMHAHQSTPPPRPSDRQAGIPSRLDDVIADALAKAPDQRYPSASDLAVAAQQAIVSPAAALAARPPPIKEPRPTESPAPAGTRHRRTLTAALSAIVAIGLLVAGLTFFTSLRPPETGSAAPTQDVPAPTRGAPVPELAFSGHRNNVFAVAAAQLDGRPAIVSGSADDTVRIWDLMAGTPIGQPLTGHTDAVWAVATTQLDGRPIIVSGGADDTMRIWDLTTGDPIGEPLTGHTDAVTALATTHIDGRPVVISGGFDRSVRVWDLTTGDPIGEPLTGHTDAVWAVATTQLDNRPVIVSGSADDTVRVWDLMAGTPIGRPLTGHTDNVGELAISQLDGRPVIISGSPDRTVRVWDLTTGDPIGEPLTGHTDAVWAVATTQLDNRPIIVSGSPDDTVRIWDLTTRAPVGQPLTGHTDAVGALTVIEVDGRPVIISGSNDNTVRTWDLIARTGS